MNVLLNTDGDKTKINAVKRIINELKSSFPIKHFYVDEYSYDGSCPQTLTIILDKNSSETDITDESCEKSLKEDVYTDNGFENRKEYLKSLADDFGVPLRVVVSLAQLLGPSEDFDGLVNEIEDYADDLM